MNILQMVTEVSSDCLLTTTEVVMWNYYLLESFPGELRALNGQVCSM
jgi:hypothetical protein